MSGDTDGIFCDIKNKNESYVEAWIHYFSMAV